jgi:cytochrome c peroxidase
MIVPWASGAVGVRFEAEPDIALGKRLFFDARLSADGKVSCATCHQPQKAFTDGRPVAIGAGGKAGTRNTPTLIGAAGARSLFWDGRRESVAELVADPLTNANEHGMASREAVVELVRSLPEYRDDAARLSKAAPLRFEALARLL